MDRIKACVGRIKPIKEDMLEKTQRKLDGLTKPKGSLGKLEELTKKLAAITGQLNPPTRFKKIPVFVGDHGVTEEGVSAYPQEVTHQMVLNFLRGGAAINVLAGHVGAEVTVVDLGVASPSRYPEARNMKIGKGTENFTKGPAMNRSQAIRSIERGIEVVKDLAKEGLDLLGVGDMGIGNTTASSAITAVLTGHSVEKVTDKGTGIADRRLAKKVKTISRGLTINRPDPEDPLDVLSKVGGFEIGGIAGCLLGGAALGKPMLLDGFITAAGALIAAEIEPNLKEYLIASHISKEKGHHLALSHLGLSPLLDFNLRLGEGTGACLAIQVVEASIKLLNEMDTFKEAGVSKDTP